MGIDVTAYGMVKAVTSIPILLHTALVLSFQGLRALLFQLKEITVNLK